MKLIKINEEHYIVLDDSEIKEGDYFYSIRNLTEKAIINYPTGEHIGKITHSSQPLESIVTENSFKSYEFISLQEVKELIGEVDVENKAEIQLKLIDSVVCLTTTKEEENIYIQGFYNGYNQAIEDNKEKKYTEEDIRKAILMARVRIENVSPKYSIDEISLSLQPKTEWEVETVNGKLKLK